MLGQAKQITKQDIDRLWFLYNETELTPVQFAELCSVHKTTAYRAVKNNELVTHISEETGMEGQTVLHPFTETNLYYIISALEKFSDGVVQVTGLNKNGGPIYCKNYLKLLELIAECRLELKKIDLEKMEG